MAQGGLGLKKKFSAVPPKAKGSKGKRKKPLGPRKGGHYIAPKKAKHIKADQLKKSVTKQIDQGIESAIHQQALSDGSEFRVLSNKPSGGGGPSKSTKPSGDGGPSKTK